MQLKKRFSPYVKSLFASIQPCCQICDSNDMCSVHHIFSTISSSMINGITLCFSCHRKADCYNKGTTIESKEKRRHLLKITMRAFYSDTWWEMYLPEVEKKNNDEFFEMIKEDIVAIKKDML